MTTINNFVVDHVLRGIMVNKAGEYMWSVNQITDPSLSVTMEDAVTAVDALGSTIASFDRGRNAEFTATNSIFDLGLYASQLGQEKQEASATKKIVAPAFETIEIVDGQDDYELAHLPKDAIAVIYALNGDGTLGQAYKAGTVANETDFVYDTEEIEITPAGEDPDTQPAVTKTVGKITVPTGLAAESELFVMYEYDMESGVSVTADAINVPKKGKFILEVLGCDVCDQETLIHAYVVFPNAKLDGNVDYSFTTDGTHPFTIQAQQSYCDSKKKLFSIVIPNEE